MLEELFVWLDGLSKEKIEGLLAFIQKGSSEEIEIIFLEEIQEMYTRSSFELNEILEIVFRVPEDCLEELFVWLEDLPKEKIDGVLAFMQKGSSEEIGVMFLEEIQEIYKRSSFELREMLEIVSKVPEDLLGNLFLWLRQASKEKIDGILAFTQKGSLKELTKNFTEEIIKIYEKSSFDLREVIEITSKVTEDQLEEMFFWLEMLPKEKIDGVLHFMQKSSPKEMGAIFLEEIREIYERSSFDLREVMKAISKVKKHQLRRVHLRIGFLSREKMDGFLDFIQKSSPEELEEGLIEEIIRIYERSSFGLKKVIKIVSKMRKDQLESVAFSIKIFSVEKVDNILELIQSSSQKGLKNIRAVVEIYRKTSFDIKQIRGGFLSEVTEDQANQIASYVRNGLSFPDAVKKFVLEQGLQRFDKLL